MKHTLKQIMFWLLMAGVIGVGILLPLEIFLQVRDYRNFKAELDARGIFELDPFLQMRPKEDPALHVNDRNMRGDAVDENPDIFLIFTMGGSTTFEDNIPYEQTYPALLQAKLRARYPGVPIQVQNAACDSYSTQHSIIRYLFSSRRYHPDLLVMMHAVNDLYRGFLMEDWTREHAKFRRDYSHHLGPLANIERGRLKHFPFTKILIWEKIVGRLFPGLLYGEWKPEEPSPAKIREFRSLEIFKGNLELMTRLARMDQTPLILLTQPNIYHDPMKPEELGELYFAPYHMTEDGKYPDADSMEYGLDIFNSTIHEVGKEQGVPVVDVEKAVPKNLDHFWDDVHLKEPAAEILAEQVFQKIVEMKLIPEKSAPKPS